MIRVTQIIVTLISLVLPIASRAAEPILTVARALVRATILPSHTPGAEYSPRPFSLVGRRGEIVK
jgi:hypothetical protein